MNKNLVAAGRLGYPPETPWEEVYQELSQAGYQGTPVVLDFGTVESYREKVAQANLVPAPGYFDARFWVWEERGPILKKAGRFAQYSRLLGVNEIFIGALGWDDYTGSRGLTRTAVAGQVTPRDGMAAADWKHFVMLLSQVCEIFNDNGVKPCFHSHVGSVVETGGEIEILFSQMKPGLLFMGPDTGQLLFAGIDPVAFFKKYLALIHAVHLKDLVLDKLREGVAKRWNYHQFVTNGIYTELGQGDVDFKAIIALLEQSGFSGVYVIETDVPTQPTMYESNKVSRAYLQRELGI